MSFLALSDPEIHAALTRELEREETTLELIASENFTSQSVMEMAGGVMTNKYAEGYPGKRYYGGCDYVDEAENLARERLKLLFGAGYANVQPHSGSQANMAVFMTFLEPGDTVLGLDLAHGGHLTHGSSVNFSGQLYQFISYHVSKDSGRVDFGEVQDLAQKHRPKLIVCGGSAYPRFIEFAQFREIADSVGAYLFVDMAHVAGLVAVGLYPSPVSIADVTTTTTHKTLRGARGGMLLARENEAVEKKLSSLVFPGTQGGPLMHAIAGKAVALKEALEPEFKIYQQQVISNAQSMADSFIKRGYKIVSGGTDNHLFLVDLIDKNITGKDADAALGRAYITVNKNTVPNDPRSPFVTSGLRIGTPASTTRGFGEIEIRQVADWICDVLDQMGDESVVDNVRAQVLELCSRFPVYADK